MVYYGIYGIRRYIRYTTVYMVYYGKYGILRYIWHTTVNIVYYGKPIYKASWKIENSQSFVSQKITLFNQLQKLNTTKVLLIFTSKEIYFNAIAYYCIQRIITSVELQDLVWNCREGRAQCGLSGQAVWLPAHLEDRQLLGQARGGQARKEAHHILPTVPHQSARVQAGHVLLSLWGRKRWMQCFSILFERIDEIRQLLGERKQRVILRTNCV